MDAERLTEFLPRPPWPIQPVLPGEHDPFLSGEQSPRPARPLGTGRRQLENIRHRLWEAARLPHAPYRLIVRRSQPKLGGARRLARDDLRDHAETPASSDTRRCPLGGKDTSSWCHAEDNPPLEGYDGAEIVDCDDHALLYRTDAQRPQVYRSSCRSVAAYLGLEATQRGGFTLTVHDIPPPSGARLSWVSQ